MIVKIWIAQNSIPLPQYLCSAVQWSHDKWPHHVCRDNTTVSRRSQLSRVGDQLFSSAAELLSFCLSCWAAKLLSCWATELLSYWATHTCRLWRRDQGEGAAAAGTVRAGARGGAGGGRLQGAQWYQGAQELSIFLLSLCLWLLSGAECILNGNFNVTLYGNWSHFTPSQKQKQKQEENKIWITMLRDKQEAFALYCQCRCLDIEGGKMRRFFPGSWSWYETKCLENTGDILSYWYWIGKSIWSGNMNWKLLSNFEILIW